MYELFTENVGIFYPAVHANLTTFEAKFMCVELAVYRKFLLADIFFFSLIGETNSHVAFKEGMQKKMQVWFIQKIF